MKSLEETLAQRSLPRRFAAAITSLLAGLGATFALFHTMAGVEHVNQAEPEPVIEDLRIVSMPTEPPPPPRPVEHAPAVDGPSGLSDIQVAPSANSPVRVNVVPPDLADILPRIEGPPPARIETAMVFTELKPRTELAVDSRHIYQQHEVDQPPRVLYRANPWIPPVVRNRADKLQITLILILDTRGVVTSVRTLKPSGNPYFDNLMIDSVKTGWGFSPAVKNSRNVRCMIQQTITVKWEGSLLGT
jgi:outer membrane biosynthesis protein TonB